MEGGSTRILVDVGLTMRETKNRLELIGVRPEDITAVIITHEHTDHIKGVGPLCRAYKIPLYITSGTHEAAKGWLGGKLKVSEFEAGTPFSIDDMHIEPFSIPHDAADPVGFAFHCGPFKAGLATDLGYPTKLVGERLKGSNLLIIESNHDPEMLKSGPYPWPLKQRVAGKEGHLSNEDAGKLLAFLLHDGLSHVVLAHLSQINNLPELAMGKAKDALEARSYGHINLKVAMQDEVGGFIGV